MKKNISMLLVTLVLTFAFSVTCFAKMSPTPTVITPEETTSEPKSGISPKTGVDLSVAFVVLVTTAGIALVARKKYSEAN